MEREKQFKRGERVQYIGGLCANLHKVSGTVKRYDREGWCIVDFDNGILDAKTYDFNLRALKGA